MLKKILIGLSILIAAFIGGAFLLPSTHHVERSIVAKATPATVFTVLNSFKQFNKWSPWAEVDPNAKTTYEGPESGIGAKMSWSGNRDVGTGSQEIVDSQPASKVVVKLTFGDFSGDYRATYLLAPEGEGTKITWGYDGDYGNNVMGRWFGMMSERMLGPDYEKGLAKLKALVEGLPQAQFEDLQITTVDTQATPLLMIAARSPDEQNSIGVALGVGYSKLGGYISTRGLAQVAPPVAIFYGEAQGALSLDAAIPVDRADVQPAAPIRAGRSHAGRALRAVYRGPYSGLGRAREGLLSFAAAAGYVQDGPRWEQYVSDPSKTAAAELVTYLFVPIR